MSYRRRLHSQDPPGIHGIILYKDGPISLWEQHADNNQYRGLRVHRASYLDQSVSAARPSVAPVKMISMSIVSDKDTMPGAGNSTLKPLRKARSKGKESGERPKILFVDDEIIVTRMVAKTLPRFGYAVIALTSSEEALDLFAANPSRFDMFITDQSMPILTGTELSRKMLEIRPDLPIILISGHGETIDVEGGLTSGIRKIVAKPIEMLSLAHVIEQVLAPTRLRPLR